MGESRDVYIELDERAVIRTADVYQTEVEAGTAGYSDTLLSVVANFKNSGAPEGFNAQSMVGKSKRGEVALRLFAVVDPETQTFVHAGFKSRGCLAMTACASVVCTMIKGKTFAEALTIRPEEVKEALDGVPWDKVYTTYFAAEGVRALVGDYLINSGATIEQLDEIVPCDEFSVPCAMCEHCSLRTARVELRFGAVLSQDKEISADQERAEHNALALVFDDVRCQSAESELVCPSRWPELGVVPEHLSAEAFEMLVYDYLKNYQATHDELQATRPAAPVYRTASRAVGVPRLFAPKAEEENAADEDVADAATEGEPLDALVESLGDGEGGDVCGEQSAETANERPAFSPDNPFANLKIPAGYRLVELEGEYVLVEDEHAEPVERTINSEHISILVGAHSYYLYDSSIMTDTYAHWAFLAAEDDSVVTFVDCVREDSRIYPRPLAASSLQNPPFIMSDASIVQAWDAVRESGEYPDIEQTIASNGDVYFYSTKYLSATYAASLAEWDAVERRLCL